jgi:hypothetical protein
MKSCHQTSDPSTPKVSSAQTKFQKCEDLLTQARECRCRMDTLDDKLDNWPDSSTRCRFCTCDYSSRCAVPEGRYGFTRCLWNYELNCCTRPRCVYKAEHGEEELGVAAPPAPESADCPPIRSDEIISILSASSGIYSRIARSVGVSPSVVRRVALRKSTSARISVALAEECALIAIRIRKTVLSGSGVRVLETRSRETKAQPATASPDTAGRGANGEAVTPAPERHAASPSSLKPRVVLRCMDTPSFSSTFGVTLATVPGIGGAIEIGRPHVEAAS